MLYGLVAWLPDLQVLQLSGNQLKDLNGLEGCANLRVLDVSRNQLTDLQVRVCAGGWTHGTCMIASANQKRNIQRMPCSAPSTNLAGRALVFPFACLLVVCPSKALRTASNWDVLPTVVA